MAIIYYIFAFCFGAAIGSFLNVLIYRIPKDVSIVKPGSFCPNCQKHIPWYENIPIVSYIILGGKCSGCKHVISFHYPIIEAVTGLLLVCLFHQYHLHFALFFYLYFFAALIAISGVDFSNQTIPDVISIPAIFIGLVFQFLKANFLAGLLGLIFGGGLILLIRVIGGLVYKKEVMGMGDVYLAALIGAFIGFPLIISAIFLAALTGTILGLIYLISTHQNRETPMPFGPFLSIGAILTVILQIQLNRIFAIF